MTSPAPTGRNPMPVMCRACAGGRFWGGLSAAGRATRAVACAGLWRRRSARARCSESAFFRAAAFSAADGCCSPAGSSESGGTAGLDPTSETLGNEATFCASASDPACGAGTDARAAGRGTRTSTVFPSERMSNSASATSSMTTRAVRVPACATAARRSVPSPISSSRCSTATSVSAKSTTTRGGERSFKVVNERGRSLSITTPLVRSSPPIRTPSSRPCSSAVAPNASTPYRSPKGFSWSRPRPPHGVFHQVLHVRADLVDVGAHGELEVAVFLHWSPEEVFAPGGAADPPRASGGGDLVQVAEEDGHGDVDVAEVRLVVVPGAIALHLVVADPAGELLHHPAGLLLPALGEQPAKVLGGDARGIQDRSDVPRDQLVALEVVLSSGARQRSQERVDGNVVELEGLVLAVGRGEQIRCPRQEAHAAQDRGRVVAGATRDASGARRRRQERPPQRGTEQRRRAQAQKAASDVAGRADRDQSGQVVVRAGVAVPEHPAHAGAEVEDLRAPGPLLHRLDCGGNVVQEVAVDVPVPIEVAGTQAARDLQLLVGESVTAQLDDVDVRAVREQLLDEVATGECVPVLRPAGHEQERLAQDGLMPGLRDGLVAGDPQHPAVAGGRVVNLFRIQRLERYAIEVARGRRGMVIEAAHGSFGVAASTPWVRALINLRCVCRSSKLAYRRSLGIGVFSTPSRSARISAARYSEPQQRTTPPSPRAASRAAAALWWTWPSRMPASCSGGIARGESGAQ